MKKLEVGSIEVPSTGKNRYLYEVMINGDEEVFWFDVKADEPELGFATACHFIRKKGLVDRINCKTYHTVMAEI